MSRREWWETQVAASTAAVPDLRWTVDEVVVAGDRAVVRCTDSGTPTSAWMGLEPTGAAVRFREHVLHTLRDGPGARRTLRCGTGAARRPRAGRRAVAPELPLAWEG